MNINRSTYYYKKRPIKIIDLKLMELIDKEYLKTSTWNSRKVLSWRLPNTLDTELCIDALEDAINRYGTHDIFNTIQGTQFTSKSSTGVLKRHGIRITIGGRGHAQDNIFIDRLWWTEQQHYIYLHVFDRGLLRTSSSLCRGCLMPPASIN